MCRLAWVARRLLRPIASFMRLCLTYSLLLYWSFYLARKRVSFLAASLQLRLPRLESRSRAWDCGRCLDCMELGSGL